MKKIVKFCFALSLLGLVAAIVASGISAQTFVYVNDNNGNFGANTATQFNNTPLSSLVPPGGIPYPTTGTSLAGPPLYSALKPQTLFTTGTLPGTACLFVSESLPGPNSPNGQITVFNVNTATGALTLTSHFLNPTGYNGAPNGIGLATAPGAKTLYAAYSGSKFIAVFSALWNGTQCVLDLINKVPVMGLAGGAVDGMAFSFSRQHLVVAYADGSVQAFKASGFSLTPECPTPQNSAGFTDGNTGIPAGVDITKDSRLAVFGDASARTEVEVALLPLVCSPAPTRDFGGSINAGGVNLGAGVDSDNVWLSPAGHLIYVSNTASKQVTSLSYAEPFVVNLATGCTAGHTNPTSLTLATFTNPGSIQTGATTGTGGRIFVAEYGNPSSVAVLGVDAAGCTKESPSSPITDSSSNFTTHTFASYSVTAEPPRPY